MLEEQAKAAAEKAVEPLPVDTIKISDLELQVATLGAENRALQLESFELRESKDAIEKLQQMFQNLYNKTHKEKAEGATQTDQLDHYAIFSMMLKEIMRVTPELRNAVLPQAKFMDLYWKYFDLAEELKQYMCELPKLRKPDKMLGNMDYFE